MEGGQIDMWRFLLSCLTVFVLSGCAISIDEPNPQAEPDGEQAETEQEMTQDEQQTEDEEKPSKNMLTQIFEHFLSHQKRIYRKLMKKTQSNCITWHWEIP